MGITDKYSLGFFLPIFIVPAITLVEIIQFRYKSDVRFVSDLRKIGSRISDWKLDPNGSQSEPIGKNYQNTIGTNYHSDARN